MGTLMLKPGFWMAVCIMGSLVVAGIWDVYCYYTDRSTDTVTSVLQEWVREMPILAVAVGILLGHLFFPSRRPPT